MTMTEKLNARRAQILSYVESCQNGAAFSDMLPMFSVSASCLQRDLNRLRKAGSIVSIIGNMQSLWVAPSLEASVRRQIKAHSDLLCQARRERKAAAKRAPVSALTQADWVQIVAEALLDAPDGLTSQEIRARTGRGMGTVKRALPMAKAAGLCDSRYFGHSNVRWFHRDHAESMDKIKCSHVADMARLRKKRNRDAAASRELQAFELPVLHRIVPAHLARPIRPAGPSSVWGLAA